MAGKAGTRILKMIQRSVTTAATEAKQVDARKRSCRRRPCFMIVDLESIASGMQGPFSVYLPEAVITRLHRPAFSNSLLVRAGKDYSTASNAARSFSAISLGKGRY